MPVYSWDKVNKKLVPYVKYVKPKEIKHKIQAKSCSVQRGLGYNPINSYFNGCVAHHLHYDRNGTFDNSLVMYIPKELHDSHYHGHRSEEKRYHTLFLFSEICWKWYDENIIGDKE
jgi:hypothetical protein